MQHNRRHFLAGMALTVPAFAAWAQTYPVKPIRMIVPFPPGGPVDLTARLIGGGLSESLGQPIVFDNRSGAGGVLGTDLIAKAPPDGYTIGMGTISSFGINPGLMEKMPFDVQRDFVHISNVSATSGIILAAKDAPFNNLKEMIAYAKANPGKISYASAGLGSVGHMVGAALDHAAGIQMTHVPYRGTGPAAQDLLAGNVMTFIETSLTTAINYLPTGRIKAIAITRKDRSPFLPDVPSLGESGFPEIDSPAWFGVVAPAKTPQVIVQQLNRAIHASIKAPQIAEQFARFGAEAVPSTPEEFSAYIGREVARWKGVVKAANIKPI